MSKKIESIAKVCHQANKAFCEANGDTTQKDWEKAPAEIRASAIKGVEFRLANPKSKESAQHDAWLKHKVSQGYKYGKVKDDVKKTHPCIVAFEKLPKFQQQKDALFCAVVDSLK